MVFSSPLFVFFFLPITLAIYNISADKFRNTVLLAFSLLFYCWGESLYIIILSLILLNWIFGLLIGHTTKLCWRQTILTLAIFIDIGVLFYLKYENFIINNFNEIFSLGHFDNEKASIPLGISFFTFHVISYIVDIYRKVASPQKNPINFALYICFFPQLIAGPIIRYHDISEQLQARQITVDRFCSGLERFALGFGKKILIANPLGHTADQIFSLSTNDLSAPTAWLGIICYSFQIYFDFSGYSDMAIGLGRMFGFTFLENFNYPYISLSIREFWRRWHISLSNWFKDYLYVPLGGSRRGSFRTYGNLFIVFFLCGMWHGANWNFVIWGLLHGFFLAAERGPAGRLFQTFPRFFARFYVLLVVMIGWVFFRSDTLADAWHYLAAMCGLGSVTGDLWPVRAFLDRQTVILLLAAGLGSTPALSFLARDWRDRFDRIPGRTSPSAPLFPSEDRRLIVVRPVMVTAVMILACAYLVGQSYNPFIYYRF